MAELDPNVLMQGWPWWARFAVILGFPAMITLLVLYEAHTSMGQTKQLVIQHINETDELMYNLKKWSDIIRANCINNAEDNAAKDRCIYGLSAEEAKSMQK